MTTSSIAPAITYVTPNYEFSNTLSGWTSPAIIWPTSSVAYAAGTTRGTKFRYKFGVPYTISTTTYTGGLWAITAQATL